MTAIARSLRLNTLTCAAVCWLLLLPIHAMSQPQAADNHWSELSARLDPLLAEADAAGIRLAIGVQDLSGRFGGATLMRGSDERYHPASTIKMLLIATLMSQVDASQRALSDRITVFAADIVGGYGVLQNESVPQEVSLARLAELTVTISDNTATNVLVELVGYPAMRDMAERLGLENMQFGRKMFEAALPPEKDNYIDAADAIKLLGHIWHASFLEGSSKEQILAWLGAQTVTTKIAAGVPAGTLIAHKTGENGPVSHDMGYLLVPGQEVAVALFAEFVGGSDFDIAQSILNPVVAEAAGIIHQYLQTSSD